MEESAELTTDATPQEKTYVLFTLSGDEDEVIRILHRYVLKPGEDAFCPTVVLIRKIHGRDRKFEKNLYPGYVFLTTSEPYDLLVRLKKSVGVVLFKHVRMIRNRDQGYIYPLELDEAQMLYELCGEEHQCGVSQGYIQGDKIIVLSGPLANFSGRIKSINRHKKNAIITTKLLNREINVTVALQIIKRVKE